MKKRYIGNYKVGYLYEGKRLTYSVTIVANGSTVKEMQSNCYAFGYAFGTSDKGFILMLDNVKKSVPCKVWKTFKQDIAALIFKK